MVEYWPFLYVKKSAQQSELDKLSRRLAFKLPIVLRYNVGFAIIFGILHSAFSRNTKWMKRYMYMIPLGMTGLCLQEISKYLQIRGIIDRKEVDRVEEVGKGQIKIDEKVDGKDRKYNVNETIAKIVIE